MYQASFESSHAKIERAIKHLDALEEDIFHAFDDKAHMATLRADADGKTGYHIISMQTVPDLSQFLLDVSVRVGDIAHNFRSALDHIAWQLACLNTDGQPRWPRRVQFPIEDDPAVFGRRCRYSSNDNASWLGEVDPRHHAVIERFQPYQGLATDLSRMWSLPYIHEFAILRDIPDLDKHRVLVELTPLAEGFQPDPGSTR